MSTISSSIAIHRLSPEFQIAVLKTAQDTPEQKGKTAANLIRERIQATIDYITGNKIDLSG